MGNSNGKESRASSERPLPGEGNSSIPPAFSFGLRPPPSEHSNEMYTSSRVRVPGGHHPSMFNFGTSPPERDIDPNGPRKETRQEKEARRAERERAHRLKERERSLKEEGVDGGYLVTLGTYVGTEDFSKPIVRQLQIERRLAPFWRGLNDHSDSWTEHQLVAAARGLPIPAPDEIPPREESPPRRDSQAPSRPNRSFTEPPVSITRESSSTKLSAATPGELGTGASHSSISRNTPSPLFRGRSKGTASLSATRDSPEIDIVPEETHLPKQPMINGQPVEAYLYKDVAECPICFLYYPPFLNRTRCCDQYICSECFVQIKRPDPHNPEHADPSNPPSAGEEPPPAFREEQELVSEPATCPFCVTPELGVTYDPPPFRRGIVHANREQSEQSEQSHKRPQRQRGPSLSAASPKVVTTDQVRPEWSRKLSEARSHAARRSAAATALHTAAYNMNGFGSTGHGLLGRRRRPMMTGPGAQPLFSLRPDGGMNAAHLEQLMAALEAQGESSSGQRRGNMSDLIPRRNSSRAQSVSRTDDLEEMMMMEAIRLSLQAEEERKKKEGKEQSKVAKKDEKKRAKEQKKIDKAWKKNISNSYASSANNSQFFESTTSLPGQPEASTQGKGKAKITPERSQGASLIGFNPMDEPTSTVNSDPTTSRRDPQRHLERSRANLSQDLLPVPGGEIPTSGRTSANISYASSANSSTLESAQAQPASVAQSFNASTRDNAVAQSSKDQSTAAAGNEHSFNFGSLAQIIGREGLSVDSGGRLHASNENTRTETSGSGNTAESSSTGPQGYQAQPQRGNWTETDKDTEQKHGAKVEITQQTQPT